jgi:hypothetical protein
MIYPVMNMLLDAPALKVADIGIAVAAATDAVRGASGIVLTEPGLACFALGSDVVGFWRRRGQIQVEEKRHAGARGS